MAGLWGIVGHCGMLGRRLVVRRYVGHGQWRYHAPWMRYSAELLVFLDRLLDDGPKHW